MSDQDLTKNQESVLRLIELAHLRHESIPEPDRYIPPGHATLDVAVLTSIQAGRELKE